MLVATMTEDEVFNEIHRDWIAVVKSIKRFSKEYNRMRIKRKISKEDPFFINHEMKSKSKNPWCVLIHKPSAFERYKGPHHQQITAWTYYYNKRGLQVFRANAKGTITAYNGHLFRRYDERMKTQIVDPLDQVKRFFAENYFQLGEKTEDGRVNTTIPAGLLLGTEEIHWILYRTFISDNEIMHRQEETMEARRLRLEAIMHSNGEEDSKLKNFIIET